MPPPAGPARKPMGYEQSGPFDKQEIESDIAQQLVRYERGGDIDERWRNDLLRFVLCKRNNSAWKAKWGWNNAWLKTPSKFQPGCSEINYKAWFAELRSREISSTPVFDVLMACHDFSISCDEVAVGPLKNEDDWRSGDIERVGTLMTPQRKLDGDTTHGVFVSNNPYMIEKFSQCTRCIS